MSTYVFSDLHGRYDLYEQINNFLKDGDTAYCLGDTIDRGPESWRTLNAVINNPKMELLLGNHEHLLAHAMLHYISGESNYYANAFNGCIENGGYETFESWVKDGMDKEWATRLLHLSKMRIYDNESGMHIVLTHAGFTPGRDQYSVYDLVWDRKHMEDDWPADKKFQNTLIIHGHTPVQLVDKNATDAIWYGQGHKIDIDCGSVWSGRTCLFDLDTLDEHYFQGPEGE